MERRGDIMRRFERLELNTQRQSEISEEELIEDDKEEFFNPEDNWDDTDDEDEPYEREYCD